MEISNKRIDKLEDKIDKNENIRREENKEILDIVKKSLFYNEKMHSDLYGEEGKIGLIEKQRQDKIIFYKEIDNLKEENKRVNKFIYCCTGAFALFSSFGIWSINLFINKK